MRSVVALFIASYIASTDAFMVSAPACSLRYASRSTPPPTMGLGTRLKKIFKRKEDPSVTAFRSSLSSMDQLSDLSERSLEKREGRAGRTAGVWKEMIKADGRKWYYNTDNGTQQWTVPEEFLKLDEISAAAAAANAERGTSLG